jgi:predicted transcriptional regulator
MVEKKISDVALLSIHPIYAEAILSGKKVVEFRKVKFANPVKRIYLYATKPVGRIVASMEVKQISTGSPSLVWRHFGLQGGVDAATFWEYYDGTTQAVVICIGQVRKLRNPVSPTSVHSDLVPSQNYVYLSDDVVAKIDHAGARESLAGRRGRGNQPRGNR